MKKILISIAVIGFVAMSATAAHAASDGEIHFTGKLVDTSCNVSVGGGGPIGTIILPNISVAELDTATKTAGDTGFTIALSACSGSKSPVRVFFELDKSPAVDPTTGRLNNTADSNPAANVQLELLDGDYNPIVIGGAAGNYTDISSGSASIPFSVRYYAKGVTTPGDVTSMVTFSLDYQ